MSADVLDFAGVVLAALIGFAAVRVPMRREHKRAISSMQELKCMTQEVHKDVRELRTTMVAHLEDHAQGLV